MERPTGAAERRRDTRDRLLLAILPHVTFDGWTDAALAAGAQDAGLAPASVARWFPGGVDDVVDHFADWADRAMVAALARHDLAELRVRDRVALAVRLRLEALAPHREAVRRALARFALPPQAARGMRALYRTVDAIWHALGDRSVDFSFYTKRALLAGVVSATVIYWLDDSSGDSAASWAFLGRRIDDVMRVPAALSRVRRMAGRLPDPLAPLRALGRRGGRPLRP